MLSRTLEQLIRWENLSYDLVEWCHAAVVKCKATAACSCLQLWHILAVILKMLQDVKWPNDNGEVDVKICATCSVYIVQGCVRWIQWAEPVGNASCRFAASVENLSVIHGMPCIFLLMAIEGQVTLRKDKPALVHECVLWFVFVGCVSFFLSPNLTRQPWPFWGLAIDAHAQVSEQPRHGKAFPTGSYLQWVATRQGLLPWKGSLEPCLSWSEEGGRHITCLRLSKYVPLISGVMGPL